MNESTAQSLEEREAALAEREEKLKQMETIAKHRLRDNLYDRIPVSAGTMNIVIAVVGALLTICLIIGVSGAL